MPLASTAKAPAHLIVTNTSPHLEGRIMKPSKLLSLAIVLLTTGWVSLTAAEPISDELQEVTPVTVTFSSDAPVN